MASGISRQDAVCERVRGVIEVALPDDIALVGGAHQVENVHRIHRVTEALERLMEEDAAADRPFIAALAISSEARGTSHKPYTLLTAFDHPHILIGKSEMVTNFMHQNMSNNRIQRELTSRPKIEDRIPIEKNPIW